MEIEIKEIVVNILIVVDVNRAQQYGSRGNFYLFSTRGHHDPIIPLTTVRQGDKLIWRAMPLNSDDTVGIAGFGGPAVPGMMNPGPMDQSKPAAMWSSLVTEAGLDVSYELILTINDVQCSCKCLLSAAGPRRREDASE